MALWIALVLMLGGAAGTPPAAQAKPETPDQTEPAPSPMTARAVGFVLQYGALPGPSARPTRSAERARSTVRERSAPHDGPHDRWWARDKAKHLVGSALWTLSTQYVLVAKADWSEGDALPVSIASGVAVGLAKEVYDRQTPPAYHFSTKDLAADAAGIALAVGIILL